jgi:hypothetical protein
MKKLLLTLAMAFGAINSGFAADLYVNNSGQSGTYSTINGALAAASSGDRIFVSPMNFYAEDLTITKSILISPTNSGSKISLDGSVYIQPIPGMEVSIIGLEADKINLSSVASTASLANTAKLNIVSSTFSADCGLRASGLLTYIHDSHFKQRLLVTHCEITKSIVGTWLAINKGTSGSISSADTVRIIACHINLLEYSTEKYHLFALNNYFNACYIYEIPSNALPGKSIFANNYVHNSVSYLIDPTQIKNWTHLDIYNCQIGVDIRAMYKYILYNKSTGVSSNQYSSTDFYNESYYNASTYTRTYPYYWTNSGNVSGTKTPNVLYCQVSLPFSYFYPKENLTGIDAQVDLVGALHYNYPKNQISVSGSPKDSTWISQFYGLNQDLGSPASNFADLDLTRNDIGILGGSHSWLNYWYNETSTTGNAVIRWIDLPSEIWPGQTVNLKAEAVHTN